MSIFYNVLSPDTAKLYKILQTQDCIKQFYLSGGTGLSLQFGHRESIDLDFFTANNFNPNILLAQLKLLGETQNVYVEQGTLNLYLNQVKLQFLYYPYAVLMPNIADGNINISHYIDIACTKLNTIASRGSKKDFIDLYFVLQKHGIQELVGKFESKYSGINFNLNHIFKSLVFFDDAEKENDPHMLTMLDWQTVKSFFVQTLQNYSP